MLTASAIVLAAAAMGTPPPQSSHVLVANAWFRALPASLPAGGYFELRNLGRWPVTLTGAESGACGMLMMHKSESTKDAGSMEEVPSIDVPAHGSVRFSPGGYHLMCTDPAAQMKPGRVVAVTLRFSDTTTIVAKFRVRNARGR